MRKYIISQGLSFTEAINQSGFSDEDKQFVTLIYAREAYRNNYLNIGDYFMKFYKYCENKTESNDELYFKIIYNKRLLPHKTSDLTRSLNMPIN